MNSKIDGDLLSIKNWELETYIGCLDWEKTRKQKLLISFSIKIDNRTSAINDDIANCVEYTSLVESIKENFTDNHYNLLETFAEELAKFILTHALISTLTVEVKKRKVIEGLAYASIEITRTK
jgi:7,8-dihydroneopterin aldolase/epimerase/oxygenase